MSRADTLQIVVDTREQRPYDFAGLPVETGAAALRAGDYSLPGYEGRVAVERKELSDLIGCLTYGRPRFTRELARLASYEFAAVVVEAGFLHLLLGRYRSNMKPVAAVASIAAMHVRHGVPFLFAGDRRGGERLVYELLRRFQKESAAISKGVRS